MRLAILCVGVGVLDKNTLEAAFRRINQDNPRDPLAAAIFELDNGLTVYVSENHQTPRFSAEIAVRVGAKQDPPGSEGLAHFLGRLLSHGTKLMGTVDYEKEKPHLERVSDLLETRSKESDPLRRRHLQEEIDAASQLAARYSIPNEIKEVYDAMGQMGLRTFVGPDEIVCGVDLPSNRLNQWALIESDRFQNSVFRGMHFAVELIYEEQNRFLKDKEHALSALVQKQLFKNHPYGQLAGAVEASYASNPSMKKLKQHHRSYFVPNNSAIFISGSVDTEQAIRIIDKHFAGRKSETLPPVRTWPEPPLRSVERVNVTQQGAERVLLAFRLPSRDHPDAETLRLAELILNNPAAGLINKELNGRQKVAGAGSAINLMADHGAHFLWGVPKSKQTVKEVENLLLEQLERLKSGRFEGGVFESALLEFKKSRETELEFNDARVGRMRNSFISSAKWDQTVDEMRRMENITKEEVVNVVKKYYDGGFVAGCRFDAPHDVSPVEMPEIEKIHRGSNVRSDFALNLLAMEIGGIQPKFVKPGIDFQKLALQEGVEFYYSRNPVNRLFTLTFSVDTGTRHDNRLAIACLLLRKSGSKHRPASQLAKAWARLGTDLSITPGEVETTLTLTGLDENFRDSVRLLTELMEEPAAAPETLDELKRIMIAQRESSRKDVRTTAAALSSFNRHGTNSPYLRALSSQALKGLERRELHKLTSDLLGYKHSISYVGGLSKEKVVDVLRQLRPASTRLKPPPPYPFLRIESSTTNRILFLHTTIDQAQIRIETCNDPADESSQATIQLFNNYFSGATSGVVFQELRGSRPLAYSAGAVYSIGIRKGEQSLMAGQITCSPENTAKSIDAFVSLLQNLPVSPGNFEISRLEVINRYRTSRLGYREVLGAVREWEHLDMPVDPRESRFQSIHSMPFDTVLDFHNRRIKNKNRLISIVGDRLKLNLAALEKFGEVTEMRVDQLFAN